MKPKVRCRWDQGAALAGCIVLVFLLVLPALGKVETAQGQIELPTYPWWPAVKHPYFRGTDGKNIYPYPMRDNLSRAKQLRTYRTVVLENDYLRITFLPELGGKIHEVIDKTTGEPMFYVNHVVKPGLIGQCGAWTSGGVEWNTGPQGHTVSCMQPVTVQILPRGSDGSRSVAIGETERIYRTQWTVIVTLRPGRSFIEERIRIANPTDLVRPYYFWNCTAMPNTPGFRFLYPMTLGTDHSAQQFFNWPIHDGKDLSRGTNYQDASSIFAWHCDQDFFGSYDDGADRGVVAYANHHQVPGKKAWTWGQGSFGRMHQMDLTDDDGPYNEVQTGPLLTQGEVGRLDPQEAVSWREWWYPVKGLGGFVFANRDVAVNAALQNGRLQLRMLGTGSWSPVRVSVAKDDILVAVERCKLSPRQPTVVNLAVANATPPFNIELASDDAILARFRFPLDLPKRQPPSQPGSPETAAELAQAGWQKYLFAKFPEAEKQFRAALTQDAQSARARTGLAYLNLEAYPVAAISEARAALAVEPDQGLARLAWAVAAFRLGDETAALDQAWKAALDPATAVAGRALAARLLLRQADWAAVVNALSDDGPWNTNPTCRNLLALAHLKSGDKKEAVRLCQLNLQTNPLDGFTRGLLWLARAEPKAMRLADRFRDDREALLDLVADFTQLNQEQTALRLLETFYLKATRNERSPILHYWAAWLSQRQGQRRSAENLLATAQALPAAGVFPHRWETEPILRWALKTNPADDRAALYLGHLLFFLGRHNAGREAWYQAAKSGSERTLALRALGMAWLHLDHHLENAAKYLQLAHAMDPSDPIAARDYAQVLFQLAGKENSAAVKQQYYTQAVAALKAALPAGRNRSDCVTLLARALNQLGRYEETARLLDQVRITVWEGAHKAHDLFEAAHLALGKAHLAAGRSAEALREFDRALDYPKNLATGKLANTCESHIHLLRGNALAALGKNQEAIAAWTQAVNQPASKDAKREAARAQARSAIARATSP